MRRGATWRRISCFRCRSLGRPRTWSARLERCCSSGCTDGRQAIEGVAFISAITAGLSAMAKSLASELAPIRVNVIAAGFVDTHGSSRRGSGEGAT